MRVLERKFSGQITGGYIWVSTFITIGSNIRGRRFKEGYCSIDLRELEQALTPHPDCLIRLRKWLDDLNTCFIKESQ